MRMWNISGRILFQGFGVLAIGFLMLSSPVIASSENDLEVENPNAGRLTELSFPSRQFGVIDLLIYTPPGYFALGSNDRLPVIYWLHGSGGTHLDLIPPLESLPVEGKTGAEKLDTLISSDQVPPFMMVAVRAPQGSWDDSLSSLVNVEVPAFIDANFRSVARRGGRGLEGFSLGSEGVSRYVTLRPDVFATASLLGGGFLPDLWTSRQTAVLRDKVEVAQFVGANDGFLFDAETLADQLTGIGVPNEINVLPGVVHSAPQIYGSGGIANLQFHADRWRRAHVVDAGFDQSVDAVLPSMAPLVGTIDDSEGLLGSFTTTWEQVSGPAVVVFSDATSLATMVTLPAAGTYFLRLKAEGDTELCDVVRVIAIDTGDGLQMHLTFDAGDGADASGNGRTGTLAGGPLAIVDGRLGGALNFDGLDDSVVVGDFSYGASWSLSMWVRPSDLEGSGYQYVASHNGFDFQPSFNLYLPEDAATFAEDPADLLVFPEPLPFGPISGRVRAAVRDENDPSGQFTTAEAPVDDGQWHHLLLTLPVGGGHKIFVDGQELAGKNHGGDAFDPPGDIFFGTRSVSPDGRHFKGDLDEIRLYDRELLGEEIVNLAGVTDSDLPPVVDAGEDVTIYLAGGAALEGIVVDDFGATVSWTQESGPGTATFTDPSAPITGAVFDQIGVYILRLTADDGEAAVFDEVEITVLTEIEPGLLGNWPLDSRGPVIRDISGLAQDGVVISDGDLPDVTVGQNGNALIFDGADNQAVVIAGSQLLAPDPAEDDFSITLWLKVAPGAEGSILSRGATDPSARQYQLFLSDPNSDGESDLNGIVGGLTNDQAKQLGVRVDDDTWHHIGLVHDASTATNRLYIDGQQIGMAVPSGTAILDVSVLLGARRIDADDTGIGFPLTGALDDVRIYGRALSESEIADVLNSVDCLNGACVVFTDGFETGDFTGWSSSQP